MKGATYSTPVALSPGVEQKEKEGSLNGQCTIRRREEVKEGRSVNRLRLMAAL